ncbi:MAG: AbrB/MazE/SpoVT family DNA-binding domain-containing protein [Endozoicomonas sp.]|uniref:AbrB/MazE/SpoVT family DNA-binding domain-containing protein n=1 Tax=Endozoicomonas sp. TaxID=1892382 RepID=UPI003D9BBAA6
MPKVSSKRQITLPAELCREAGIQPGDEYASYIDNQGHITIVKKEPASAKGLLKHIKPNQPMTDEESRQSGMPR